MSTLKDKHLTKTNIATWNLKGKLHNAIYQGRLVKDMKLRKFGMGCLQETRWHEDKMIHLEHRTGNGTPLFPDLSLHSRLSEKNHFIP